MSDSADVRLSVHGVRIRLPAERWHHIVRGHPEMAGLRDEVLETVESPDEVQLGDSGELIAVRLPKPMAPRHIVVVYRESTPADGFVITAYLTRQPSRRRRIIWTR